MYEASLYDADDVKTSAFFTNPQAAEEWLAGLCSQIAPEGDWVNTEHGDAVFGEFTAAIRGIAVYDSAEQATKGLAAQQELLKQQLLGV